MIKAAQTLAFFLKENARLIVPNYQRPYSWRGEEAGELVTDLRGYVGQKANGLYLGTIILDISRAESHQEIEIVDGQQRLTSIFLLLIACREHARKINAINQAQATQKFISFTDDLNDESTGMRLHASLGIRPVFEHMATSNWDGKTYPANLKKVAIRHVRRVYDYFLKEISELDATGLNGFREAIYSIRLIRIDIDAKEEAFSIFERTNDRGRDLEVADLLKNYLHQQQLAGIDARWSDIVANASQAMPRMLKSFYVAQRGAVQKSELYKKLRKYSDSETPEGFLTALEDYAKFFSYFTKITTNREEGKNYFESAELSAVIQSAERFTEIHRSLLALKFFKVTQAQSVFYAACLAVKRLGKGADSTAAKALVRLAKAMECFHFINTFVCSRIGNEVEQLYADFCDIDSVENTETFRYCTDVVTMIETVISTLRKNKAPEPEFAVDFKSIDYSDRSGKLYYIFDRFNRTGLKATEAKDIFYPESAVSQKENDIEHIGAQALHKEANKLVPLKLLHNIGNLTVMSQHLNKVLGNKTVVEKFKLMNSKLASKVAAYPELKHLATSYSSEAADWNDEVIERRSQDLATYAYGTVWKF